jgi:flagellar hook protein FlgE
MRLTRKQMSELYPNQWLGLTDVKYVNDDGISLESAEVAYTDKSGDELLAMQIDSNGKVIGWYTNDDTCPLGFLVEDLVCN